MAIISNLLMLVMIGALIMAFRWGGVEYVAGFGTGIIIAHIGYRMKHGHWWTEI